jgi:thiol-disulfide isomerase/thioredoxin
MKIKTLSLILAALLVTALGAYVSWQKTQPTPEQLAVTSLMATALPDVENKTRKLQEWQGKLLLINFWATWCPPCVSEMPELVALQTELADKNLQIIGIGIDSPSNIREFSSTHHITYPLLVAGMNGTELARQFGNQAGGLPFTVLISPQGQVRKVYLGRLDMKKLREDLLSPQ